MCYEKASRDVIATKRIEALRNKQCIEKLMDTRRQHAVSQVSFLVTLRVPSPTAQGLAALTTTHDPWWWLHFGKPVTQ